MDIGRMHEILEDKSIQDIFYDEKVVWVQEVKNDIVRVGFLDGSEEKDVYIDDLYERNLYN